MEMLIQSLIQVFWAVADVLVAVVQLIWPWIALLLWIAFWMLAVNWVELRKVLLQGGWIGLVFIGLVTVLVWMVVDPPAGGSHLLLGLKLSNFVGKLVYVTALFGIMQLCGAVQLSGVVDRYVLLNPEVTDSTASHGH